MVARVVGHEERGPNPSKSRIQEQAGIYCVRKAQTGYNPANKYSDDDSDAEFSPNTRIQTEVPVAFPCVQYTAAFMYLEIPY